MEAELVENQAQKRPGNESALAAPLKRVISFYPSTYTFVFVVFLMFAS